MLAISNLNRTLSVCNLVRLEPNMLAMSEMVLESRDYDFWTNLASTNFRWLQAYLVPFERDCKQVRFRFEIAGIFSPLSNRDCKHIRFPFLS